MGKNSRPLKYASFLIAIIILYMSSPLHAQTGEEKSDSIIIAGTEGSEILFMESSWDSVLKKANETGKYIFVDANAVWCAPCRMLKATTFRNKGASDFFNQHFINYSIDMERGEGLLLASAWQVETYPTLLIFDATGKIVLANEGFLKAEGLIEFGKMALAKKVD